MLHACCFQFVCGISTHFGILFFSQTSSPRCRREKGGKNTKNNKCNDMGNRAPTVVTNKMKLQQKGMHACEKYVFKVKRSNWSSFSEELVVASYGCLIEGSWRVSSCCEGTSDKFMTLHRFGIAVRDRSLIKAIKRS